MSNKTAKRGRPPGGGGQGESHFARKKPAGLQLVLLNTGPEKDCTGMEAVPGRLPRVLRFPGESFDSMVRRALSAAHGTGVLVVKLEYSTSPPVGSYPKARNGGSRKLPISL